MEDAFALFCKEEVLQNHSILYFTWQTEDKKWWILHLSQFCVCHSKKIPLCLFRKVAEEWWDVADNNNPYLGNQKIVTTLDRVRECRLKIKTSVMVTLTYPIIPGGCSVITHIPASSCHRNMHIALKFHANFKLICFRPHIIKLLLPKHDSSFLDTNSTSKWSFTW